MFKLSLQECMSCGRRRTRTVVIVEVGLVVWVILKKVVVLTQEKDANGCIGEGGLSVWLILKKVVVGGFLLCNIIFCLVLCGVSS